MNLKRNLALLLCLIVVAVPSTSLAKDSDVSVGFVDLQRALVESVAGSKAQKEYEKVVKAAQSDLEEKKTALEKQKKKFDKQVSSLSDEAKVERQEKLLGLERDLKRAFQDSQEMLRRKNAKIVGELVKELRGVVANVGKDEGFTIILEKGSQAVLYADSSIDITDKVIKRFDAR